MVATVKKSVETAVAKASQDVRVANITKSVTERTAEDAVVESSQIKHVAVERSLKMQTISVTTITVKSETVQAVTEGNRDQGNGGEVCVECGRECPEP